MIFFHIKNQQALQLSFLGWAICIFGAFHQCSAQSTNFAKSQFARRVTPPSEEVAKLGSFGNLSPDYNTGVAKLTVPLIELRGRQLTLPISLNYSYSGLMVEETSSWVGLGWVLSAGGVVTRTVQGLPDEMPNGYLKSGWNRTRLLHQGNIPVAQRAKEIAYRHLVEPAPLMALYEAVTSSELDAEPDLYSVTLPGFSGKIGIDSAGVAFLTPKSDYTVATDANLTSWIITGGDGTKYVFGVPETYTPFDISTTVQGSPPTAWHLNVIYSADRRDTISLDYTNQPPSTATPLQSSTVEVFRPAGSQSAGQGIPCYAQMQTAIGNTEPHWFMDGAERQVSWPGQQAFYNTVYLHTITTATTIAELVSGANRLDLAPVGDPPGRQLTRVIIRSRIDGRVVREFELRQSYFNALAPTPAERRLRLDAVREIGKPAHEFSYEGGVIPSRRSLARDHWGYYNGAQNLTTLVPKLPIAYQVAYGANSGTGADRASHAALAKTGALRTVRYPTGGQTLFEYEPNTVSTPLEEAGNLFGEDPPSSWARMYGAVVTGGNTTRANTSEEEAWRIRLYGTDTYPDPINVRLTRIHWPDGALITNARYIGVLRNGPHYMPVGVSVWQRVPIVANSPDSVWRSVCNIPAGPTSASTRVCNQWLSSGTPIIAGTFMLVAALDQRYLPSESIQLVVDAVVRPATGSAATYEREVGGLRVKKLVDVPIVGDSLMQYFDYTTSDNPGIAGKSSGKLFKNIKYWYTVPPCSTLVVGAYDQTRYNTLISGYHIGYKRVKVSYPKKLGGTKTFVYLNDANESLRALVLRTEERDQVGLLVRSTENTYDTVIVRNVAGLRMNTSKAYWACAYTRNSATPTLHLSFFDIIHTENNSYWPRLLMSKEIRHTASLDSSIVSLLEYRYQPIGVAKTTQPTHVYQLLHGGKQRLTHTQFVSDYLNASSGNDVASTGILGLQQKLMFSLPIEQTVWIKSSTDSAMIGGELTHFSALRPAKLFAFTTNAPPPTNTVNLSRIHNGQFLQNSGYRETLRLSGYDNYGNLVQQLLPDAVRHTSFLWGYRGTQQLAETVGAAYAQTAYTSFEPDATGRWVYDSVGTHIGAGGRTGRRAYRLDGGWGVGTTTAAAGDYELLYWAKPTAGSTAAQPLLYVNGAGGAGATLRDEPMATGPDGWRQYRLRLRLPANSRLALDASAAAPLLLDEVRLHPVGAQMTSYTHDPLVGMTSQTDPTGRTTTYEYDALGRLLRVRDEQGRILKQNEYKYAR